MTQSPRSRGETVRREVGGPYFDDLAVGQVFRNAPAVTLTDGLAAAHHAIVGNRGVLALSGPLAREVTGGESVAPQGLAWDVSIGQSTVATQRVRANLFYRGLSFLRYPALGDTLRTETTIDGLRENKARQGRAPSGLAALHITTRDQHNRVVLDFWRCAMLDKRPNSPATGHADDLTTIGTARTESELLAGVSDWNLAPVLRDGTSAPRYAVGDELDVAGGDVVSSAPELARLTGNVAAVHHDRHAAGGERLVYGGHTIGLALLHVQRALPNFVAVTGWQGCDHLGPVHEGDTVYSTVRVDTVHPVSLGQLLMLSVETRKLIHDETVEVLRWQPYVLVAGTEAQDQEKP